MTQQQKSLTVLYTILFVLLNVVIFPLTLIAIILFRRKILSYLRTNMDIFDTSFLVLGWYFIIGSILMILFFPFGIALDSISLIFSRPYFLYLIFYFVMFYFLYRKDFKKKYKLKNKYLKSARIGLNVMLSFAVVLLFIGVFDPGDWSFLHRISNITILLSPIPLLGYWNSKKVSDKYFFLKYFLYYYFAGILFNFTWLFSLLIKDLFAIIKLSF